MAKEQVFSIPMALQKLRLFNEKAEKLRRSPFISKAFNEDAGITAHIESGTMRVEKRGADEVSTDAFMLTLRLFVQQRDGIQLEQIKTLYQDAPVAVEDKHWVSENLRILNVFLERSTHIAIGGQPITNRVVFETFLYGSLAHTNEDKRAVFEMWKSGPLFLMLESTFENVVGEVTKFIFWQQRMNMQIIPQLETIFGRLTANVWRQTSNVVWMNISKHSRN